jgi:hypothetical protein
MALFLDIFPEFKDTFENRYENIFEQWNHADFAPPPPTDTTPISHERVEGVPMLN